MVIPAGYTETRILGLITSIVLFLLALLQSITLQKKSSTRRTQPSPKYYVHYLNVAANLCLFILFLDRDQFWHLTNKLTQEVSQSLGGYLVISSIAIVVCSHFDANYYSLKQTTPPYISRFLLFLCVFGTLFQLIFITVEVVVNKYKWHPPDHIINCIVIMLLIGIDLFGYYKLRRLLLSGLEYYATIKNTQQNDNKNSSANVYENMLSRSWKFHSILCVLGLGYTGYQISGIISIYQHDPEQTIYTGKPPTSWGPNPSAIASIISSMTLTWWAWIPMEGFFICEKMSGSSSNNSRTTTKNVNSQENISNPLDNSRKTIISIPNNNNNNNNTNSTAQIELEYAPLSTDTSAVSPETPRRGESSSIERPLEESTPRKETSSIEFAGAETP